MYWTYPSAHFHKGEFMPGDPQYWAYLNAEWNAGRLMRPSAALQMLRTDPRGFLEKYPIQSNYDPPVNAVQMVYIFNGGGGHRPGSVLKTARMHTTGSFTIQPQPGQLGEGTTFWAHGLSTGQSSVAPVWYRLDGGDPDIVLTAKLTGCTFVARPVPGHPGEVEVVHLQPHNETGLALNQRMVVPGQEAYGRLKYDIADRSINVIGVRRAGAWKVYAQKLEKQNLSIRSVTRIYPPK